MSHLTIVLQHLELALRLHLAAPWLDGESMKAHIEAAHEAADEATHDEITVELLLGVAYIESRFDPTALSRVEGTTRRTGRYPSTTPPRGLNQRGSMFCGPLQTHATSWESCIGMRDLKTAYRAAVTELERWLKDRYVRGSIPKALAGHGCGYRGVLTGSCNGYPSRVRAMERQFTRGPIRRPAAATRTSVAST